MQGRASEHAGMVENMRAVHAWVCEGTREKHVTISFQCLKSKYAAEVQAIQRKHGSHTVYAAIGVNGRCVRRNSKLVPHLK